MQVNLIHVIEQVGKDKGLDKEVLVDAVEAALLTAAKKKFGLHKDLEARLNPELGEIEVFQFKTVVGDVEDSDLETTLENAQELDPDAEVGDSLGMKLDTSGFGRIAAQSAKQVIIQKVKEAERALVYSEYKDRVGEIVTGSVQKFERGEILVNLGRGEALLPKREQVRRESYRQGDRMRAIVLEVNRTAKGPQIILSRSHPDFLVKLFEMEVPEIYDKIVTVKAAAREPGERAKVAVQSTDSDVDAVGACVGIKGMRVQNVVQELRGEKIDIVLFKEDPADYICKAISPAQISRVIINETEHCMEVVAPDDQLSLAIGRKGQNVRLAARLTGWKLDIHSESEMLERSGGDKLSLTQIPGIDGTLIPILKGHGFNTIVDLAKATAEDLAKIAVLGSETITMAVQGAREVLAANLASEEEPAKEGSPAKETSEAGEGPEVLTGVGKKTAVSLRENGYETINSLLTATAEELSQIEGIGAKKAEQIITAAKERAGDREVLAANLASEEEPAKEGSPAKETSEAGEGPEVLTGVGQKTAVSLRENGYETVNSLLTATAEELSQIEGIGAKKAEQIITAAKERAGELGDS